MKKFIILLVVLGLTAGCGTMSSLDQSVKKLELGMTKHQVIKLLGDDYRLEGRSRTSERDVEILLFTSSYPHSTQYILRLVNNNLTEFNRYVEPVHPEVHVIKKDEKSENK